MSIVEKSQFEIIYPSIIWGQLALVVNSILVHLHRRLWFLISSLTSTAMRACVFGLTSALAGLQFSTYFYGRSRHMNCSVCVQLATRRFRAPILRILSNLFCIQKSILPSPFLIVFCITVLSRTTSHFDVSISQSWFSNGFCRPFVCCCLWLSTY